MGDEVLKRVAKLSRTACATGTGWREWGEEFMVIAHAPRSSTPIERRRLRQRVADPDASRSARSRSAWSGGDPANAPGDPPDDCDLIQLADSVLYAAKRAAQLRTFHG